MNVASTTALLPVQSSPKTGIAGKPGLLALPAQHLVGFLSLFNGLLYSAQADAASPGSQTMAIPDTADSSAGRADESERAHDAQKARQIEKSKRALPLPQPPAVSAKYSGPVLANVPMQPLSSAAVPSVVASLGALVDPVSFTPSNPGCAAAGSVSQYAAEKPEFAANSSRTVRPLLADSLINSETDVAFALRLTPQNGPSSDAAERGTSAGPNAASNLANARSDLKQGQMTPDVSGEPLSWAPPQRMEPDVSAKSPQITGAKKPQAPQFVETATAGDSDAPQVRPGRDVCPEKPEAPTPSHNSKPGATSMPVIEQVGLAGTPQSAYLSLPNFNEAKLNPGAISDPSVNAAASTILASETRVVITESSATQEDNPPHGASPDAGEDSQIPLQSKAPLSNPHPVDPSAQGNGSVKRPAQTQSETETSTDRRDPNFGGDAKTLTASAPEKDGSKARELPATDGRGTFGAVPAFTTSSRQDVHRTESPAQATTPSPKPTELETNPLNHPQPIREISLRLDNGPSSRVEVQLATRSGHIQVAVRTGDQQLTQSLQTNLGDLVGRLEDKGYKTETWVPTATLHTPAVAQSNQSARGQDQPADSGSGGGSQQQQGQQDSNHRQPARWMTQLEETLSEQDASTNQ